MHKLRRTILLANGVFLLLVGGAQFTFDLLSHFLGAGPLGTIFTGSSYTIGFAEAHGLAFLFGVLFIRAARSGVDTYWHLVAVAVHILLGGANLLFWPSFVAMGLVPMGVVATAFHGLFVASEAWCAKVAHRPVDNRGCHGPAAWW